MDSYTTGIGMSDDLLKVLIFGWAFAFLWGSTGYLISFVLWRVTGKVLAQISIILDQVSDTLEVIRDDIDLKERIDALAEQIKSSG